MLPVRFLLSQYGKVLGGYFIRAKGEVSSNYPTSVDTIAVKPKSGD